MKTLLEALKILMNGLAMVSSSSGYASSANGGYVYNVTINDGGYAWFAYTGTLVGSLPACADPNGLWIMNAGAIQGQAMLSGLLSALARHQRVDIQGTGTCAGGHELVSFLIFVGQ